jgi:SAM-dependent methyltransferase
VVHGSTPILLAVGVNPARNFESRQCPKWGTKWASHGDVQGTASAYACFSLTAERPIAAECARSGEQFGDFIWLSLWTARCDIDGIVNLLEEWEEQPKPSFGMAGPLWAWRCDLQHLSRRRWRADMSKKWIDALDRKLCSTGLWKAASWSDVIDARRPKLYAGLLDRRLQQYATHFGVTPYVASSRNIRHDIRNRFPIPDNSVEVFQSEDVFEHIEYADLGAVFAEIRRVLRPGGLFRFSVPDYRCRLLVDRSIKADDGTILFDPLGDGQFVNGRIINGGHVWFPVYESVKALFEASQFEDVQYLHYTDAKGQSILQTIDYSLGNVLRTPDHDERAASPRMALSIVVDARK